MFNLINFNCCFSQSWKKDSNYIKHWKRKENSCIHFFQNDKFVGYLLDGKILIKSDFFILSRIQNATNFLIDSNSFNINIDTPIVIRFEDMIIDYFNENPDLLLPNPKYLDFSFYIRQYVGFNYQNTKYLFAGFQLDKENVKFIDGKYFLDSFEKRNYDLYNLIYTKIFFHPSNLRWSKINDFFYVLYNIETEELEFYFMDYVIKD